MFLFCCSGSLPRSTMPGAVNGIVSAVTGGLLSGATNQPTLFSFAWLGVVPYLTKEAVWSTLGFIASLPNGAHVVFDYSDPSDSLSPAARILYDNGSPRLLPIPKLPT